MQGTTSKSKQIAFMENMIDLVSTVDSLDSSAKILGKTVTERYKLNSYLYLQYDV